MYCVYIYLIGFFNKCFIWFYKMKLWFFCFYCLFGEEYDVGKIKIDRVFFVGVVIYGNGYYF